MKQNHFWWLSLLDSLVFTHLSHEVRMKIIMMFLKHHSDDSQSSDGVATGQQMIYKYHMATVAMRNSQFSTTLLNPVLWNVIDLRERKRACAWEWLKQVKTLHHDLVAKFVRLVGSYYTDLSYTPETSKPRWTRCSWWVMDSDDPTSHYGDTTWEPPEPPPEDASMWRS